MLIFEETSERYYLRVETPKDGQNVDDHQKCVSLHKETLKGSIPSIPLPVSQILKIQNPEHSWETLPDPDPEFVSLLLVEELLSYQIFKLKSWRGEPGTFWAEVWADDLAEACRKVGTREGRRRSPGMEATIGNTIATFLRECNELGKRKARALNIQQQMRSTNTTGAESDRECAPVPTASTRMSMVTREEALSAAQSKPKSLKKAPAQSPKLSVLPASSGGKSQRSADETFQFSPVTKSGRVGPPQIVPVKRSLPREHIYSTTCRLLTTRSGNTVPLFNYTARPTLPGAENNTANEWEEDTGNESMTTDTDALSDRLPAQVRKFKKVTIEGAKLPFAIGDPRPTSAARKRDLTEAEFLGDFENDSFEIQPTKAAHRSVPSQAGGSQHRRASQKAAKITPFVLAARREEEEEEEEE
ncbi:hypothetical protein BXZ70DRAFT_911720 [Cristinia sonorae]|uniref:Uncharacterized protein n=1 Tax=Cristinia sonorae TaxID=1940300 RepID=A0A8K0XJK7_9AGAR|nr:hypothetical protein BXZ70DRAFT_911720 [Cristinia sonorae]